MALIGPKRRSLRLENFDYSQPGAYFVTVCVNNRSCLLGTVTDDATELSEYGLIVAKSWEWLSSAYSHLSLDA